MNSPYLQSPTSSHWWSRSRSSSKLAKEKPSEVSTPSRTYTPLQADILVPDQPPKQSSMFGNFTSVIRLKPKKNVHNIAIQDPPKAPSPLIIPPSNSSEPYGPLTSRPYSKAVSAVTVTDDDSIEPKTPLDLHLTYQKSLVGSDPFAATTGVIFSSKEPQSFDQLFVAPDSHVINSTPASPVSPQRTHRRHRTTNPNASRERLVSEATAPTHRPIVTVRTQPDVLTARFNPRTLKVSMNDVPTPSPATSSPDSATMPATNGRSKSRASDGPRPHTRPRGMTDNTGIRPSLRKDVDRPPLTHKSSFSRSIITPPETKPPSQELPPVPSLKYLSTLPSSDRSPLHPASSSSSLSFASPPEYDSLSKDVSLEERRLQSILEQAKVPSEPRTKSPTRVLRGALNSPSSKRSAPSDDYTESLKKVPSQRSLHTKFTGSLSTYPDDRAFGVDDSPGPTKFLKKQRSFHYPRVPVPPVVVPYLRHATSFTPSEASVSQPAESPKSKEKEKKRESTASLSRRRFLPGSISRNSSQMATFTFDDDTGSIIIPPSELERCDKSLSPRLSNPFGSPGVESMMLPATSAFYDDLASSPTAGSHFPQSAEAQPQDTGPQQILSPAQLLQLEEMLGNDDSDVSTNPSNRTSPAELSSPTDPSPVDPPPFEEFGFRNTFPRKKGSWTDSIISSSTIFSNSPSDKIMFPDRVETGSTLSFFDQHQHSGYRPRTASGSGNLDSNPSMTHNHSTFASSSQSTFSMGLGIESTFGIEPTQPLSGLTPPPRRRPKTASTTSTKSQGCRESTAHIQPLSPPPPRRNTTSTLTSSLSTSTRSSPTPSPKSPPSSFKNDPPTRSIMKKPSFLEIDDDPIADARTRAQVMASGDNHQRNISISSINDSFLDLGRENNSFDTIRTLSVEGPG
ncbi:hypothetical protein BJ322DRAFT_774608 [Thelephora terrestris]|uniref:Uncharacterized protein n=1 Tax=Thelephora terrestris TaxID=56493 RepID=A0A9P6HGD1_9AGAM|nr:hypothetical protein BJ322DRAFT_774608 [Thelephora terrestris]